MASTHVAIAKATFGAGLRRPDPDSVSTEDIAHFHTLLGAVLSQCSPSNIQKCKDWLLKNTAHSSARIAGFGKYLTALSRSLGESEDDIQRKPSSKGNPSTKRKRLHILYLLNDLLHHTKYHDGASSVHTSLTSNLQPHLVALVELAASCDPQKSPKFHQKISRLLDLWEECGFYTQHYVQKLRETVTNATKGTIDGDTGTGDGQGPAAEAGRSLAATRDAPYVMPASHGDASTPYYDLPAGNMIPHIVPNSTTPINTQLMKPLQFMAGPADESLATVVKDFLKDTDRIFGITHEDEGIVADIDEMGQPLIRDEVTGELTGDGYYGWSKRFCERMKKRKNKALDKRDRSRGRSDSRSRSSTPRKRRRYSSSISRSRSRGRHDSRSVSRSLSPPRKGREGHRDREWSSGHSREASNSRSPHRSRRGLRGMSGGRSRSLERSGARPMSRSPSRRSPLPRRDDASTQHRAAPPDMPTTLQYQALLDPRTGVAAPSPVLPAQLAAGFTLGPNGMPLPPPPPLHGGQWPYPPPPPPPPLIPNADVGANLPATTFQFPGFPPIPIPVPQQGYGTPAPPVPNYTAPPNPAMGSWNPQSGQSAPQGQYGSNFGGGGGAWPQGYGDGARGGGRGR